MASDDLLKLISSGKNLSSEEESEPIWRGEAIEVLIDAQRKQIERLDEEIKDLKQDRGQRKKFSILIFCFVCVYMLVSVAIVFCCGFGWMNLDAAILIALLTTTLANVIGVFNFVVKYLFHKQN